MSSAVAMRRLLMHGVSEGYLRVFDVQLADRLADVSTNQDTTQDAAQDALLLLTAALCSYAVGRGNTCLSLTDCSKFEFFTSKSDQSRLDLAADAGLIVSGERILPPSPDTWRRQLLAQTVVGEQGEATPLIIHGSDHLYLGRYFELEQRLIGRLEHFVCLLYTSPSPRDGLLSRMPSSA